MTRLPAGLAALLAATLSAAPVGAADLFGGVYAHGVDTPLSRDIGERGVDVQLGYRFDPVLALGPLGGVRPYLFVQANTHGDASLAAAGMSLKLGGRLFVRPGLGLAVQTGPSRRVEAGTRTDLGSRLLFEPELGVGIAVAPRVTAEASWVHVSHAQAFGRQNPGLDTIGLRVSLRLP